MSAEAELRIAEMQERLLGGFRLLQVLVGIRLRSVRDPESRRHLSWLSDVTAALSLLSKRLTLAGAVDFGGYLQDAMTFWRRAGEAQNLRFDLRASESSLPDGHALSLAIIAHELIGNAVRHAFPDGTRGSIAVAYSRATNGVSQVVRDSGVGANELVFGEGLALVEGLVQHMGGAMQVETAPGAGVGVRIRLPFTPEVN